MYKTNDIKRNTINNRIVSDDKYKSHLLIQYYIKRELDRLLMLCSLKINRSMFEQILKFVQLVTAA